MKRFRCALFLLPLLLFTFTACKPSGSVPETTGPQTEPTGRELSPMTVTLLNVGKADCILIRTENRLAVIDTGEKANADAVNAAIKRTGTKTIDCLIFSHFDKDHIGAAEKVLKKNKALRILEPDYNKESDTADDLKRMMKKNGLTPEVVTEEITFTLDDAVFTVYPALKDDYGNEDSNVFSLVVRVVHGDNVFLFCGDAEGQRLEELTEVLPAGCTFLKVPHHGVFDSFSNDFLSHVSPAYAVITCSGSERPDAKVLKILDGLGTKTYLTLSGTVTAVSDGVNLAVSQ
ncbi:MAG: MBL fold metallo-hydrolase [Lachnospiraceae bacterium]|nr:MBL fold metallo-hydrolase [Lachnospiraceae bacterium]